MFCLYCRNNFQLFDSEVMQVIFFFNLNYTLLILRKQRQLLPTVFAGVLQHCSTLTCLGNPKFHGKRHILWDLSGVYSIWLWVLHKPKETTKLTCQVQPNTDARESAQGLSNHTAHSFSNLDSGCKRQSGSKERSTRAGPTSSVYSDSLRNGTTLFTA